MPQHSHTTQLKLTILISCSLLGALAGCGQEARKKPKPKKAPQAQPKEQGPPKVDGKTEDEWAREINSDDPKTLKRAMNALRMGRKAVMGKLIFADVRNIGGRLQVSIERDSLALTPHWLTSLKQQQISNSCAQRGDSLSAVSDSLVCLSVSRHRHTRPLN